MWFFPTTTSFNTHYHQHLHQHFNPVVANTTMRTVTTSNDWGWNNWGWNNWGWNRGWNWNGCNCCNCCNGCNGGSTETIFYA